jgi:hypothetical protein
MGGTDRGDLSTLIMMTGALGCWIAAAITLGEHRMFLFVALGTVLMVGGLALMRPRSPKREHLGDAALTR